MSVKTSVSFNFVKHWPRRTTKLSRSIVTQKILHMQLAQNKYLQTLIMELFSSNNLTLL